MSNLLLPILPGQMPQGFCFTTWQNALVTFAANMQALLPGSTFYNYGDTKPAPEFEAFPWLRTVDGRWYSFDGDWISPTNYDANERRLYVGTLGDLVTYDGGDAGTPSDRSGPMWVEDTDYQGRVPMGPGTVPDISPAKTLTVGEAYGSGTHTLTEAEGAVGSHTHAFGKTNQAPGDDAHFAKQGLTTVASYNGFYITGSDGVINATLTDADLFTLAAANGAGVTSAAFAIVPPVRGTYVIKWSGRLYRKV